jgi:hypothetical protein
LLMVGQGDNSFDNYVLLNLSIRLRVWVAEAGRARKAQRCWYLKPCQQGRSIAAPLRVGCACQK